MANTKNILFCGTLDNPEKTSWSKTNKFLFKSLSDKADCAHIDYSIKNPFAKLFYKFSSRLIYGGTTIRNPLYDYFLEFTFKRSYNKLQIKPDLVIHSSSICVPKGYDTECAHVMYTDATIMGAVKFNHLILKPRKFTLFNNETQKYIKRLKYIFTFNEWTKQSLIEDFSVDENKVVNVGFGANLNPYYGCKNYTNNQMLIVLRRGIEANKGLFLLLEAFKIANEKNSNLKLAVVGTTADPINGVTYYEGFPRQKTIELFQESSLYVMPALYEPNGMVYIEALASKTPILGLNRLAFPEFAGYGKYGFIVDIPTPEEISNTILKATSNPGLLKKMGEDGQKWVLDRYNWDIVVNKIISLGLTLAVGKTETKRIIET